MFQGVGSAYPKKPVVKRGSKRLEVVDTLLAEGQAESKSVSCTKVFVLHPDGSGELWKSLGQGVDPANTS